MGTPLIVSIGVAALLAFWAVGAHNRLAAERDRLVRRFVEVDRVLRVRRKAVLAWVAVASDRAGPASLFTGAAEATEPPPVDDTEAVLHACAQADAAGERARAKPTSKGFIGSLNMAEQVLERTLRHFMQQPAAAAAQGRRAAWVATEVQLAVARQLFNREVVVYNAAVNQFPARILARLVGLTPTATLEAGAELSPLAVQSPATLLQVPLALAAAGAALAQAGPAGPSGATGPASSGASTDSAFPATQPDPAGLSPAHAAHALADLPSPESEASALPSFPVDAQQPLPGPGVNSGFGLETAVLIGTVDRVVAATTTPEPLGATEPPQPAEPLSAPDASRAG